MWIDGWWREGHNSYFVCGGLDSRNKIKIKSLTCAFLARAIAIADHLATSFFTSCWFAIMNCDRPHSPKTYRRKV